MENVCDVGIEGEVDPLADFRFCCCRRRCRCRIFLSCRTVSRLGVFRCPSPIIALCFVLCAFCSKFGALCFPFAFSLPHTCLLFSYPVFRFLLDFFSWAFRAFFVFGLPSSFGILLKWKVIPKIYMLIVTDILTRGSVFICVHVSLIYIDVLVRTVCSRACMCGYILVIGLPEDRKPQSTSLDIMTYRSSISPA